MRKYITLAVIILSFLITFVVLSNNGNQEIEDVSNLEADYYANVIDIIEVNNTYSIDIEDKLVLSDFVTNIFVAKVVSLDYTDNEIRDDIPVTYYNLEVVYDIKGNSSRNAILKNYGGISQDNYLIISKNDEMPIIGQYYIFLTIESDKGVYSVDNFMQKILLEDIDEKNVRKNELVTEYIEIIEEIISESQED